MKTNHKTNIKNSTTSNHALDSKTFALDRYTLTASLFIICIMFFFITNFIKSPIEIGKKILTQEKITVKSVINSIETGYNEGFFSKMSFIDVYGLTQRIMQKNVIGYYDVIKDNQGSLHLAIESYVINEFDNKLIQDVQSVSGDTPLLFLHTGNKILANYTTFSPGLTSYKLKNSDLLINRVKENGVDVLDLRQSFTQDKLDPSNLFFKTDHHWKIETAFYTYKNLVKTFEENYNLSFPNKATIVDDANFDFITYKNSFLGSSGKRVGRWYAGMDDFTLILPKFDTNYTAYDYNRFSAPINGSFYDVIISEERLNDDAIDANKYTTYLYGDYGQRKFINHDGSHNILIIEDSYGLPLSSFLSLGFQETTIIDFRLFRGSIAEVVEEGNFDVILFVNQIQYP